MRTLRLCRFLPLPKFEKGKLNPDRYFRVLAKKENKFIKETDFSICLNYVFPEELLIHNDLKEIDRFVEGIEDYQGFCVHLQFLSKILGDYEKADKLEDPKAKLIFDTYSYLKSHLKERFPEVYAEYQAKIEDYLEKSSKKQARPNCIECRSKNIVSNGVKTWLCKDCGRQFRKVKRKQHPNLTS